MLISLWGSYDSHDFPKLSFDVLELCHCFQWGQLNEDNLLRNIAHDDDENDGDDGDYDDGDVVHAYV